MDALFRRFRTKHAGSAGGVVTELTPICSPEEPSFARRLVLIIRRTLPALLRSGYIRLKKSVQVGSIYHGIRLVRFLRDTLGEVRPPLLVVALPCQVGEAIGSVCDKAGFPVFVISLVCSGQLSLDTRKGIFRRVADGRGISGYRYRGGGWPSGVRITCEGGDEIFLDNNRSIWTDIFHSAVFNLPGCFKCRDTFGMERT